MQQIIHLSTAAYEKLVYVGNGVLIMRHRWLRFEARSLKAVVLYVPLSLNDLEKRKRDSDQV
jgi:hypothetical protein